MQINPKDILELVFYSDDLGRLLRIRDYLKELLKALWIEGDSFSGKRPLGNSGWQWDVAKVLIESDTISGSLDEDGYIVSVDGTELDTVILQCIEAL